MHIKKKNICEPRKAVGNSFPRVSKKKKMNSKLSRKRTIPSGPKIETIDKVPVQKGMWRVDEFFFLIPIFLCIDLISSYFLSDSPESATIPDVFINILTLLINSITFSKICELIILNVLFILLLQLSKLAAENYFFIFFSCFCITIFPKLVMFPKNIIQDGTLLTPQIPTVVNFFVYFAKMCLFKNAHTLFNDDEIRDT